MHLPLDLDDDKVCADGVKVQVGGVTSQQIFESDELSLSKYRWRIDANKIISVFCEEYEKGFVGNTYTMEKEKRFVISVESLQSGKPLILKKWTDGDAKQEWVNGHFNDAVRVFQPNSNDAFSIDLETSDNSLLLGDFLEGDSSQQWVLLDKDGHLGGCTKHRERCHKAGECCFGMECAEDGYAVFRCLHVPRQLGEPCDADDKCADPYHCGGYGGDGEKVCRELMEGEEGDKCGNVFGCKEGLFCIRKRCLNKIGYEKDPITGEWEAYSHYQTHQGTRDGWGYVWDVGDMWKCATKDLSKAKGKCDFDDPCVCTATLPGSNEYTTYRALVQDINSKQAELETLVSNLAAVNKFNHDMAVNQDSIAWSYSSYTSEHLGQQLDVCADIGGFVELCSDNDFEGIEKEEYEVTCEAAQAEYESHLNAVSQYALFFCKQNLFSKLRLNPFFLLPLFYLCNVLQDGEYCGTATRADVLTNQFSSEILTLQEDLITKRSERDGLIEAQTGVLDNDENVVEWYAMEQFKEPWKFREGFLETHKCYLITGLLWVLKQIFNIIGKVLMTAVDAAITAATFGTGGAVVAAKEIICAGLISGHPGAAFYISSLEYAIAKALAKIYNYFRAKDQQVKIWNTLTRE